MICKKSIYKKIIIKLWNSMHRLRDQICLWFVLNCHSKCFYQQRSCFSISLFHGSPLQCHFFHSVLGEHWNHYEYFLISRKCSQTLHFRHFLTRKYVKFGIREWKRCTQSCVYFTSLKGGGHEKKLVFLFFKNKV